MSVLLESLVRDQDHNIAERSLFWQALTFLAIGTLFLFVFRLLTRVHALERDLTRLVRAQALANPQTVAAEPRA